jgi:LysM repeat protein
MTSDPSLLLRKIRRLSQTLLISGALNMGVLGLLSYWMIRENPPTPYCELMPASNGQQQMPLADCRGCVEVVTQLYNQPFHQLVSRLNQIQVVENGYAERDLALSCLITFHHFDIQRALPLDHQPQQKRLLTWMNSRTGKPVILPVYPNLTDKQFESIIHFAKTERWPMTAQGIFLLLQKQKNELNLDANLVETFTLMPEFWTVELLFSRGDYPIHKQKLLEILIESKWDVLRQFVDQQRQLHDLSDARRQKFLLDYVKDGSPSAAEWMLKTQWEFAVKKLDDSQVIAILQLLDKTVESERFAKEMLTSPRSTNVWRQASLSLYAYAKEDPPKEWNYQAILSHFVPEKLSEDKPISEGIPSPQATKGSLTTSENKDSLSLSKKNGASSSKNLMKNAPSVASSVDKTRSTQSIVLSPPPVFSQTYVVQEGDSLWKISRKFKVDLNKLKEFNKLQSDTLKPGLELKIPPF